MLGCSFVHALQQQTNRFAAHADGGAAYGSRLAANADGGAAYGSRLAAHADGGAAYGSRLAAHGILAEIRPCGTFTCSKSIYSNLQVY